MGANDTPAMRLAEVDPPARMAALLAVLLGIVLAPCAMAYATGAQVWLLGWPASIWAALFVIQITEPDRDRGTPRATRVQPTIGSLDPPRKGRTGR